MSASSASSDHTDRRPLSNQPNERTFEVSKRDRTTTRAHAATHLPPPPSSVLPPPIPTVNGCYVVRLEISLSLSLSHSDVVDRYSLLTTHFSLLAHSPRARRRARPCRDRRPGAPSSSRASCSASTRAPRARPAPPTMYNVQVGGGGGGRDGTGHHRWDITPLLLALAPAAPCKHASHAT